MGTWNRINKEELIKEIQGKTFEKWIIISLDKSRSATYLICTCECGTIKSVSWHNIVRGDSKNCGHCNETKLLGQKIGRLTVLCRDLDPERTKKGSVYWICQCDCENKTERSVRSQELLDGSTESCGCLRREMMTLHGMSKTREHAAWKGMFSRTTDPNNLEYRNYGERGIIVDEYYHEFINFYNDIGPKPGPGYSVGRIRNDESYKPGNIRWETPREQANNRRTNNLITYNNKTMTLANWSREVAITEFTIWSRIYRYGWTIEEALSLPVGVKRIKN